MQKIDLPDNVKQILAALKDAGYEGYVVGGCVRDSLLNRQPDDWDITTNAKPLQIKELFKRTVDTGIQHGTVTVLCGNDTYEVTTYRIDGEYEDNRHPKKVEFTADLIEDLKRRDFTINAMAYNDTEGLIDEFDGIGDLNAGIIRCVGDPRERFNEDALRIMRAVRFSAQLGYAIEKNTLSAIKELSPNLRNISAERINTELTKLIVSPNPGHIRIMYETGICDIILPELSEVMNLEQNNPHHCYSVGEHIIKSVEAIEPDRALRYAMLFHDLGKKDTRTTDEDGIDHFRGHVQLSAQMVVDIAHRLKFDNATISKVKKLVAYHDVKIELRPKYVRRMMNRLGSDDFADLLKVKQADMEAQSDYKRKEKQREIDELKALYEQIIKDGDCVKTSDLAINGKDLIDMGVNQGPEIGSILNRLLEKVMDDPALNTKEKLTELLDEIL